MPTPKLSIVVASCVGAPFINRCLESLATQRHQADLEFIVVDRAGVDIADGIERDFPWVKLIRRPAGESVPDLRRRAIEIAQADYIAIIEEHCVAREDWIATILRCIEDGSKEQKLVAAIRGVVADADYERLMDWAVYFTEYNSYMPPLERGATDDVCAANCVYRRDLLLRHLPQEGSGYWEAVLNQTLLATGERFVAEPELVVYHTGPFGFGYYLWQRFLFSRAFAGVRRATVSTGFRLVYLLAAPLLIPLLWARTASRVYRKRHRIDKFIQVLPILIPVTATYVAGEWVGFLAGPGDSLSKIE
ncbi:MAG: glycosyltransferase [Blastocatellia bacterium]